MPRSTQVSVQRNRRMLIDGEFRERFFESLITLIALQATNYGTTAKRPSGWRPSITGQSLRHTFVSPCQGEAAQQHVSAFRPAYMRLFIESSLPIEDAQEPSRASTGAEVAADASEAFSRLLRGTSPRTTLHASWIPPPSPHLNTASSSCPS